MKKILFIINTLENGGAERVLINLLNHLPSNQFDITLITLYSSGIYDQFLPGNIKHKYFFKKKASFFNRIMLFILCRLIPKRILYKWVVKEKFDYEIAWLQGFPTELIRASTNRTAKKITFVHSDFSTNYDVETLYHNTNDCLKSYRSFDKVCFVSQSAREGFNKKIGELNNACVVHNVLDTKFIGEQALKPTDYAFRNNVVKIVTVGRLVKLKAFDRLIDVIEKVKKDFKNIECFIVGDGVEREELQSLVKQKHLEEEIKFLGYQSNPYKYVKDADLYVCTSLTEGYSTSVIESIFLGVPVLTTNVSGMKEIIGNTDSGIIVENSTEGLYQGLYSILSNEGMLKNMKEAAMSRGKAFQTQVQVEEFINMLDNIQ